MVAVLALVVALIGVGSAPASAADASVVLSNASITRDPSTATMHYSVEVDVSDFKATSDTCQATIYCTVTLYGNLHAGGRQYLGAVSIGYNNDPTSFTMANQANTTMVDSLVAELAGPSTTVDSNTLAVTDPYPQESLSLVLNSYSRDSSTDAVTVDAEAVANNIGLPDSVCPTTTCEAYLWAQDKTTGDWNQVMQSAVANPNVSPNDIPLDNTLTLAPVSALKVTIVGASSQIESDTVPVSDAEATPDVQAVDAEFSRNPTTTAMRWDVNVAVVNAEVSNGPCPASYDNCAVILQVQYDDGSTEEIDQNNVNQAYSPIITELKDQGSGGVIDFFRIKVSGTGGTEYSGWYFANEFSGPLLPYETNGGGNAAEKICHCLTGDPVDSETGEFAETSTDLGLPGEGPSLDVSRTYSSLDAATDGAFGYGWTSSFETHLKFRTSDNPGDTAPAQVNVIQENGAQVVFNRNDDGSYSPPSRVFATLTHNANGTWTFLRKKTERLVYNSDGTIHSFGDLNGDTVTASYTSGNLTELAGSGGRSITISWSGSHVSQLEDNSGRTVTYGYTSGNLTSVTDAAGAVAHYGYDGNHELTTATRPEGGVTTNVYDSHGRVTSQTDPKGRETDYDYGDESTTVTMPDGNVTKDYYANGRLASQTLDYGTSNFVTTSSTYDDAGNIVTSTDGNGQTTTMSYDTDGNMLTSTDPLNKTTTYTYNSLDEETSVTDPNGKVTHYGYDSAGNKTSEELPSGATQHWTYNTDGTVASYETANGHTTTYTYNSAGLRTGSTDSLNRTTATTYTSDGDIASTTNGENETTTYTSDADGRVLTSTDNAGHKTTNTYDGDGNLLTSEDPKLKTTTNTYDADDELTSTTDPLGHATSYTYDSWGNRATQTVPGGHTTTWTYDKLDLLTSRENADGKTTHYTYDGDGHVVSTQAPSGATTLTAYDDDGRLISTTDPRGKVTTLTYNAGGQEVSSTDPLSRETDFAYTDNGQLKTTTYPDSSTSGATYDADGNRLTFTNPDGDTTHYSYDADDELTATVRPGTLETDETYDAAGRTHTVTEPDKSVVTTTYDTAGLVSRESSSKSGSTDITFGYDADGNRTSMHDQVGTSTYTYNDDGQLTGTEDGNNETVEYAYNTDGELSTLTYPNGLDVDYAYDAAGQMTSATDWNNSETDFSWTDDGQLRTVTDPNGVVGAWTYNADGDPTSIDYANGSTDLATFGYTYDNAEETSSATSTFGSSTSTNNYSYDPHGELTTVSHGSATDSYTPTSGGELTTDPAGDALSYNSAEQLTTLTPVAGAATTYVYNDDGSRTTSTIAASGPSPSQTTTYGYDAWGNLDKVQSPSSSEVDYASNGDGIRETRTVGTNSDDLVWSSTGGLPQLLDDGNNSFIYGPNGQAISQISDATGATQYLHSDKINSTRLISNAAGSAVDTATYDAFGNESASTGTATTALGYAGQLTDTTTGLVYMRSRDYDASTGQFIQVDPAVAITQQAYAYASNDPVSEADPAGLKPCTTDVTEDYQSCNGDAAAAKNGYMPQPDKSDQLDPYIACLLEFIDERSYEQMAPWGQIYTKTYSQYGGAINATFGVVALGSFSAGDAEGAFDDEPIEESEDPTSCEVSTGGQSFRADTEVTMADGSRRRIDAIRPGQRVKAEDESSGSLVTEKVSKVWLKTDSDLLDVVVRSDDGARGVLRSTARHLIWDDSRGGWVRAAQLSPNDVLRGRASSRVRVVELFKVAGAQPMWDLTVSNAHDFFVGGETFSVLVHNCPMIGENGTQLNSKTVYTNPKLKYRIDVENPAPGVRDGQMHLQDSTGKTQYDFTTGDFPGVSNRVADSLSEPDAQRGIAMGLRYLGEQ